MFVPADGGVKYALGIEGSGNVVNPLQHRQMSVSRGIGRNFVDQILARKPASIVLHQFQVAVCGAVLSKRNGVGKSLSGCSVRVPHHEPIVRV